jgi:hypothetical protein
MPRYNVGLTTRSPTPAERTCELARARAGDSGDEIGLARGGAGAPAAQQTLVGRADDPESGSGAQSAEAAG